MSNILLLNEGFASGWFDDIRGKNEKTISQMVLPIYFNKYKVETEDWKEIHSTRFSSKKRLKAFISSNANPKNELTIVAKSRGAYEVVSQFKKLVPSFNNYRSVTIFLIDANRGSFVHNKKEFDLTELLNSNVAVHNFYQRKKKFKNPWGARIPGAINQELQGVDHMSIIHHPSIRDAIRRFS